MHKDHTSEHMSSRNSRPQFFTTLFKTFFSGVCWTKYCYCIVKFETVKFVAVSIESLRAAPDLNQVHTTFKKHTFSGADSSLLLSGAVDKIQRKGAT